MHRLKEELGWKNDNSLGSHDIFRKKLENFKMIVYKHHSNKTWTLSLEDNIDDPDLNNDEPEEVIIDFDVSYEFVVQFDLLMSNFKNYMRNQKIIRLKND